MMDKKSLSLARKHLREENKKWPVKMTPVPKEDWPNKNKVYTVEPSAVFRSREFLAQVFSEEHGAIRVSISRCEITSDGNWVENITWDELQRVKSECGFGHLDAVEVYPKDSDVVNVANMRHLWVMVHPLPFAWRTKKT